MDDKVKEMFASRNVDFKALVERFPGVAGHFDGANPGKINEYDNGVKSVVIDGRGKVQPSTFGYLPEGEFVFNVGGNQETMHFLFGDVEWGHGKKPTVKPAQYDILVIPSGEDLVLKVKSPTLYLCEYLKK